MTFFTRKFPGGILSPAVFLGSVFTRPVGKSSCHTQRVAGRRLDRDRIGKVELKFQPGRMGFGPGRCEVTNGVEQLLTCHLARKCWIKFILLNSNRLLSDILSWPSS